MQKSSSTLIILLCVSFISITNIFPKVHADTLSPTTINANENDLTKIISLLQITAGMPVNISSTQLENFGQDGLFGLKEVIANLRYMLINNIQPPMQKRSSSLRRSDSCTTLINRFRQKVMEDMKQKIMNNLNRILEWRNMIVLYEDYPYDCYDCYYDAYLYDVPFANSIGGFPPILEKIDMNEEPDQSSDTNVQVQGVDEADFLKNIGQYIYILANGKFRIIDAWPPENMHELSTVSLEGIPKRMFVKDSIAYVYSSMGSLYENNEYEWDWWGYRPYESEECTYGYDCDFTGDGRKTRISMIDISDKMDPKIIRTIDVSGSLLGARRINNSVFSALMIPGPDIEGLEYWPEEIQAFLHLLYGWGQFELYELLAYSDDEIRNMFSRIEQANVEKIMTLEDTYWLPKMIDSRLVNNQWQTREVTIGNCENYLVADVDENDAYLSVLSMQIDEISEIPNASVVVGKPGAVYASSDSLYIASRHQRHYDRLWFWNDEKQDEASTVHKFSLKMNPPGVEYAGSGIVKGRVLNQFSMDEYQGFLRIATTTGHVPNPEVHSTLSVLQEKDGELVLTGQIDNIAPTEDIRSVRFDRDRGYIVTFKKTDPLFALDLSSPYTPTIAGELKIPGYSTYMHRIDDQHLLSIGYDTTDHGSYALFQGILLQIFDVSDLKTPLLKHRHVIGTRGTSSEAATNHLAFTYFAPRNVLAIPMTLCPDANEKIPHVEETFDGLMVFNVTTENGFNYLGGLNHHVQSISELNCFSWWTRSHSKVLRSIFMDDYVFSIAEDEIRTAKTEEPYSLVSEIFFTQ